MTFRAASTAFALLLLAACHDEARGPGIASLTEVEGGVSVRTGDKNVAGEKGMALVEGDIITTGSEAGATVEFQGGNVVKLGPNTSFGIKKAGGITAQFGAILLQGTARATSRGNSGIILAIGTPFGLAEIGGSAVEAQVSTTQGLVVNIGTIEVITPDGKRQSIGEGGSLSLTGFVIPLGKKKEADLVASPLTFVLLGNPREVQVKRAGETAWRAPAKRDELKEGDELRTRKANGTRLQVGDHASVTLRPDSDFTLVKAEHTTEGERARYVLASGSADVAVARDDKGSQVHEIEVAGQVIKIEPGAREAEVEVSASPNGRAQLNVRLGKATLPDGRVIDPGSTVSFEKGSDTQAVRPLATTHLELSPKSNAVVYFTNSVPPVNLDWPESKGPYTLEVARDREFGQLVLRETLDKTGFVYDRYSPGRYFWRVKADGGTEVGGGGFAVEKAREADCQNCKRTNLIDDTGENTTVWYQKSLPAITFRWNATPGAVQYRLKIFSEDNLDSPLVNSIVKDTTFGLPTGRLAENKYFWLVVAMDEGGRDVATGRMNGLTIAYDNAVTDIDIKAPKPSQRVNGDNVTTFGEVQLGVKLAINGKPTRVDGKGRFRDNVALGPGENQIIYRTLTQGAERYYVREVSRR